jgi:hypothetical protein
MGSNKEKMSEVKTARSYRSGIVDDNAVISLNLKWLGQLCILASVLGWSGYKLLDRLEDVEKKLDEQHIQIGDLLNKQILEEQVKRQELEEKINFYEKEFNINPLSWGKKRKRK